MCIRISIRLSTSHYSCSSAVHAESSDMAHEDGWPLGMGALNAGARRAGSSSFSTAAFTPSQSHRVSSFNSSDVDTESAWSLPRGHGGGMTLATLIGLVDAMESRRHHQGARASKKGRLRALLLSLCLRSHLENGGRAAPSLGQFLEMERRASGSSTHVHSWLLPWNHP